jgi:hypothetical protein
MNSLAMTIEHWAAWAPGVETRPQWQQWAQGNIAISDESSPDVGFLPAMFRRRLSRLSKMMLRVAFECLHNRATPVRTVFCSRHGELPRTTELLNSIVADELLSPTLFSMSVHNTASGLYSIAHANKSASSAIASGSDTLESGFLDATASLHANDASEIMLVIADEPPPEPFKSILKAEAPAYAAAFLLAKSKQNHNITLELDEFSGTGKYSNEPHALSLLRFLINNEQELVLNTDRLTWTWRNANHKN